MTDEVKVFAGMPATAGKITHLGVDQIFFGISRYEATFNQVLGSLIRNYGKDAVVQREILIKDALDITDEAMKALKIQLQPKPNAGNGKAPMIKV